MPITFTESLLSLWWSFPHQVLTNTWKLVLHSKKQDLSTESSSLFHWGQSGSENDYGMESEDAGKASHLTNLRGFTWGCASLPLGLMRTWLEGWLGGMLVCSGQASETSISQRWALIHHTGWKWMFKSVLKPWETKSLLWNRWKGKCYPFSPFHGFFHVYKLKELKCLQRSIGLSWSHFPISTYLRHGQIYLWKMQTISQDM